VLSEEARAVRNREWMAKYYTPANKEKIRTKARERNRRCRRETIEAYGGKCACCGEPTFEFLALDHVNGGGTQHRRELGNVQKLYRWLKLNNYPDTFRLLCHNCNSARGYYGYCPHQLKTSTEVAEAPICVDSTVLRS
jgi:hypothetical protein